MCKVDAVLEAPAIGSHDASAQWQHMSDLESLRALRAQGVINAAEFISLATELAATQASDIDEARSRLASLHASPIA